MLYEVITLAAQHPQVRLVQHEVNKGYGTAVLTGLTHASKERVFFPGPAQTGERLTQVGVDLAHADVELYRCRSYNFV